MQGILAQKMRELFYIFSPCPINYRKDKVRNGGKAPVISTGILAWKWSQVNSKDEFPNTF